MLTIKRSAKAVQQSAFFPPPLAASAEPPAAAATPTHWVEAGEFRMCLDFVFILGGKYALFYGWRYDPAGIGGPLEFHFADRPLQAGRRHKAERADIERLLWTENAGDEHPHLECFLAVCQLPEDPGSGAGLGQLRCLARDGAAQRFLSVVASPMVNDYSFLAGHILGLLDGGAGEDDIASIMHLAEHRPFMAYARLLTAKRHYSAARKSLQRRLERAKRGSPEWAGLLLQLIDVDLMVISATDAAYVDDETVESLKTNARSLKDARLLELEVCRHVIGALLKMQAQPDLYDFAREAVRLSRGAPEQVGEIIETLLPEDSKLWFKSLFETKHLNAADLSGAINALGAAFAQDHRPGLARVFFEAAAAMHPQSAIASANAGWMSVELDDFDSATQHFAQVERCYPDTAAATVWPASGGMPWPHGRMNGPALRRHLGEGLKWPKITLITPSYNQGQYIEETILSVLNQDYPNVEYIVVDGASTDDTATILERYRSQLAHLIIEPDGGQTEALNKGLRLATGDLIGWINSDDMLAPGALHVMAWTWLRTQADVIAGTCIEHSARRALLINRPSARNKDFNVATLADIFNHWLKGHFFYQPEVFFTRAMLEKTGGALDESLFYSMDYDLWVKFAKAGARLEISGWPFAFFRKHASQKTAQLQDCIEEQARVRSRHYPPNPPIQRQLQIDRMIQGFTAAPQPLLAVVTPRKNKIFSQAAEADLRARFSGRMQVRFTDVVEDLDVLNANAVIYLVHLQNDVENVARLRAAKPDRLVAGWFWDNHHHPFDNHAAASTLDIVMPGHGAFGEYLRNVNAYQDAVLPLCVTQWSRAAIERLFPVCGHGPRSDALYGGFVRYSFARERNAFLERAMETLPGHALNFLQESELRAYFGRSEDERFADWCAYKTSLVVPLYKDLSQRFFDALLAGQVPLVPDDLPGFDLIVSPQMQMELPVIRYAVKDPASLERAHMAALARFDEDGRAGVERRHLYALRNHMFDDRIAEIVRRLAAAAQADGQPS